MSTRTLEACLFALVAVLPVAYAPGFASLYRLPKQAGLAVIATLVLWGAVAHVRRERPVSSLPLLFPIAIYAAVVVLSLWGARNRYEGLVQSAQTLVSLGLFWAAATLLHEPLSVIQLFRWTVAGAVPVTVLGIAQAWGADIPTLAAIAAWGSTFGNVNMAAQYLVLVLPLAVALVLLGRALSEEVAAGAALSLIATYLTYTGTRAAWGAIVLATAALAWVLHRRGLFSLIPPELVRRKAWGLAAVCAFVVVMNVAPRIWIPDWGSSRAFVSARLASLSGEFEGRTSLRLRLAIWANTSAMVADHPFLGVGKGNFQFMYPLYAQRVVRDMVMGPETRIREAHNDYVQLAAETGLLGVLVFLWLVVRLARRFWSGLDSQRSPAWLVVATASAFGLTALLAEAFFDFPFERAVPEAFFWILAGILWTATEPAAPAEPASGTSRRLPLLALGLVACVATLAAAWGLNVLRAEYHYSRGGRAYYASRLDEAGPELNRAVQLNPFDERYWFLLGLYEIRTERYADAARHIIRNLVLNPYNIGSLNNLGVALASLGRVPDAIEAFQRSLAIWPDHVEARNNLGLLYANAGRPDLARAQFEAVLKLSPGNQEARARLDRLLNVEKH